MFLRSTIMSEALFVVVVDSQGLGKYLFLESF
jgi:hypothetical protein